MHKKGLGLSRAIIPSLELPHFRRRSSYKTSELLLRLNRLLASTSDIRTLLTRVSGEIAATLQVSQVYFFVYHDENRYITAGTPGHHHLPPHDAQTLHESCLADRNEPIVRSRLARDDMMRRLLASHDTDLVIPLVGVDRLVGYLCLGERTSATYTRKDIATLMMVASELTLAVLNVLSVERIKELNATLQQRVNEATKELRHSNAQLQKLDAAKDEFVSMASHQLRTPLTSVKGYIDMVMEGDAGPITDMQRHLLGEAFTSSERMVHLINDFLNVSRLQTGKFMIDRRPVDLATIVAQEVDGLKTTAAQRKLRLSFKLVGKIPQLYLDEGKMRQVIMNFIDNAIYYSKENTAIKVSLLIDNEDIRLTVKDTGMGVPLQEQANLFTKFFRASNARKQRPDGTGVGLYLAKRVIVAHGGTMVFESIEGAGSTFGFTLPIKRLQLAPVDDAN